MIKDDKDQQDEKYKEIEKIARYKQIKTLLKRK